MSLLKFGTLLVFSLCLAVLSGCGGSDSSSEVDIDSQPGRVAILLTDGPTDDFDEVNVVITEIKLLGDDRQVSIFQGSETVNLLTLTSHANLFAFADDVPLGRFDKIRLIVSEVSLVRYNGQGSDAIYIGENDDEIYYPKQTGNGKIDLNPQGSFEVVPGETLYIQLDMDAKKSIKIDELGNGDYIFRPVVFVDVVNPTQLGKLVRMSGIVTDLNSDRFYLCDVGMNYITHDSDDDYRDSSDDDKYDDDKYEHCVKVATDSETSYFTADGMPALFGDLANNQSATVLGYFGSMDDDHHLVLDAEVIELTAGDIYQRFAGEVTSKVSATSFELLLDANQAIIAVDPVLVELIDGAKVYSMSGDKLTINDITQGNIAKVEGVVVISATDPDKIRASVVFLDLKAQSHVKLSGSVSMIGSDYFCVMDTVVAERCLTVNDSTAVYLLTASPSGIVTERLMFSSLQIADYVDVYGYYENGNMVADDLFIIQGPLTP